MGRRKQEATFWVSYSDLATGMMICFMLVTLLMVALQQQQSKVQQEAVEEVVSKLEVILGTKPEYATAIQRVLGELGHKNSDEDAPELYVDEVTAQLEIAEKLLEFEQGSHELKANGKKFLEQFTPAYACALWKHEHTICLQSRGSGCERVDPDRTGGVRKVLVTGSASMEGGYEVNRNLSVRRAHFVQTKMIDQLMKLAENPNAQVWSDSSACANNAEAIYNYMRERLWVVGAADTEHCRSLLAKHGGQRCLDVPEKFLENSDFRRVTFELDVTGDDMTGLLMHVLDLRRVVEAHSTIFHGADKEHAGLKRMAGTVAQSCFRDPTSYHGCMEAVGHCMKTFTENGQQTSSAMGESCNLYENEVGHDGEHATACCDLYWNEVGHDGEHAFALKLLTQQYCEERRKRVGSPEQYVLDWPGCAAEGH